MRGNKMKLIDCLLKLNELKNNGHGEDMVLASEKLEDSITFYKITNFRYDKKLNLCNIILKFAFNTTSQPQWIFSLQEYGEGTLAINKAYDILKELELKGYGDVPIGQENILIESYNPVEEIFYEEKLKVCSFNITSNSGNEEELLSFL
jgi:hypothetical protein